MDAMQNVYADQGLLMSLGGFKSSVRKEAPTQFFRLRLWDQDDLIRELLAHYDKLGVLSGWGALLGYTFQIYFDFSAYSDMAVGLGFMLGFRFPQNFNRPYLSMNIAEFWERWHMTLSRWLRDYIFMSLGGARGTIGKIGQRLVITMFLGGLWHGANWTFVVWGLYNGFLLASYQIARETIRVRLAAIPDWACQVFVFGLVAVGLAVFRAPRK